ncbi:hypothetical protein ABZ599_35310 [Streptomyces misionensis]
MPHKRTSASFTRLYYEVGHCQNPSQHCPVFTGVVVFLHDSLPVIRAMTG